VSLPRLAVSLSRSAPLLPRQVHIQVHSITQQTRPHTTLHLSLRRRRRRRHSRVTLELGRQLTNILRFVDYAMHRVRLLRYHGITPFIVFDGGPLPAKKGTEESRAK
jgi:hypothetical protein